MFKSRHQVDQVRQALDPLAVVRESVPSLKQAGARWRGLCPFHNERTPSFYFQPDRGLWHCFGACQEGGDIFRFVMKLEHLTFPEALRRLADRAGVTLESTAADPAQAQADQEREALLEILGQAATFYQESLKKDPAAQPAQAHLAGRKIRSETIEKFRLGFCPIHGGFLDEALRRGVPIERLVTAGLAVRSESSGRYRDPLGGRLVFPILDAYGHVVGFGGRVLGESTGPKYLNSPESPVYTKSRHLYGFFQHRESLRSHKRAVLVEGYMDVVGLSQAGVEGAVAPLGTAFGEDQARLLARTVEQVVVMFDPDEAGDRAAWRSAEILVASGLYVRAARVPEGLDPDDFARVHGAVALESLLETAPDVVDFRLNALATLSTGEEGLPGRLKRASDLGAFLRRVPHEPLRREWARKAARRLGLDETALLGGGTPTATPTPALVQVRSLEEEMLQILLAQPAAGRTAGLTSDVFEDSRCRGVAERLLTEGPGPWLEEMATSDGGWLSGLTLEDKVFERPAEDLKRRLEALRRHRAEAERRRMEKDVLDMLEGRRPKDSETIARYQTLTRQTKGVAPAPVG